LSTPAEWTLVPECDLPRCLGTEGLSY